MLQISPQQHSMPENNGEKATKYLRKGSVTQGLYTEPSEYSGRQVKDKLFGFATNQGMFLL